MEEEDQNDRHAAQDVQPLVSHFKCVLLLQLRPARQPPESPVIETIYLYPRWNRLTSLPNSPSILGP